eukprot:TRINITY_DN88003_c0_g1_i1.p1 TRINITY_DN88003_c0_g1~~TRINITY_DN88003_c0_g1_i1.p1  ORF type:complete len:543 (-),score=104.34 TRINITY_DN88003_c0_g1_i1:350-1978(-)
MARVAGGSVKSRGRTASSPRGSKRKATASPAHAAKHPKAATKTGRGKAVQGRSGGTTRSGLQTGSARRKTEMKSAARAKAMRVDGRRAKPSGQKVVPAKRKAEIERAVPKKKKMTRKEKLLKKDTSAAAQAAMTSVADVVGSIPVGRTHTKMEVFKEALQKLHRGDEAVNTGVRTVLARALKLLAKARGMGWHRVVGSDGAFWACTKAQPQDQLRELRAEGARPNKGELPAVWALRVGAKLVGCYKPTKRRCLCMQSEDEEELARHDPTALEPLQDDEELDRRRRLSGYKLFWKPGEEVPSPPAFKVDADRLEGPAVQPGECGERLEKALDEDKLGELRKHGIVNLKRGLTPRECAELLNFAATTKFVELRNLDGRGGQCGHYGFCSEDHDLVKSIRAALFSRLTSTEGLVEPTSYGKSLEELEARCRAAGQNRSACIFLGYGEGGLNYTHQDSYGRVFFPYQATVMLSRRNIDFTDGPFYIKNPATNERIEIDNDEGDVTVFAANKHASGGVDFKHGTGPVHATVEGKCERFSAGIVFNLR